MQHRADSLDLFLDIKTPDEVRVAIERAFAVRHMVWQRFDPDVVLTWDRFPSGFFEHYYGTDADRDCAIAKAVRARWTFFTFAEARSHYDRDEAAPPLAARVWDAFGMRDGVVVAGGRRNIDTVTAFAFDAALATARLTPDDEAVLRYAAALLDRFFMNSDEELAAIPRKPMQLSPAMRAVLQVAIDHPTASLDAQAAMLEISRRMLEKRHAQIAKRFGVSSFAGAVAIAVRESVEVGRV